jgi:hypothetical protein
MIGGFVWKIRYTPQNGILIWTIIADHGILMDLGGFWGTQISDKPNIT